MTPALRQARHVTRRRQAREIEDRVRSDIDARMAVVSGRPRKGPFRMRLWLPISLLWVLFPLVILVSPIAWKWRGSALAFIAGIAGVLASLSGTMVEVQSPDADIHIRLV